MNRPHDHTIPNLNLPVGPLLDQCDRGVLWDPVLGAYKYTYNPSTQAFTPAEGENYPTAFLRFNGRWGDQQYPDSDPRQRKVLGIRVTAKYGNGPTGPLDKQLNRRDVCPDDGNACIVRPFLTP